MLTRRALLRAALAAPLAGGASLCPPGTGSRVVALGDSLTRDPQSYAYVLAQRFEWQLHQGAINGATLDEQALAWLSAPTGPTLTIVGYNDMRRHGGAPTTIAAWEGLLMGLCWHRTRGSPVYLGLCLRMTEAGYTHYNAASSHGSDAVVTTYHAATRRVAGAVPGVIVVDTSAYDPYRHCGPDTVHPTAEGQAVIAGAFARALGACVALPLL